MWRHPTGFWCVFVTHCYIYYTVFPSLQWFSFLPTSGYQILLYLPVLKDIWEGSLTAPVDITYRSAGFSVSEWWGKMQAAHEHVNWRWFPFPLSVSPSLQVLRHQLPAVHLQLSSYSLAGASCLAKSSSHSCSKRRRHSWEQCSLVLVGQAQPFWEAAVWKKFWAVMGRSLWKNSMLEIASQWTVSIITQSSARATLQSEGGKEHP